MRWSKWPDAPRPRVGTLVPLARSRFLFVGDASTWSGDEAAEVDVLDENARTWSTFPSPLDKTPVRHAVAVAPGEVAIWGWDTSGPHGQSRFAFVDDSLAKVHELSPLPGTAAVTWLGAADGVLYVVADDTLFRWDRARAAWSDGVLIGADACSTVVVVPANGGRRTKLFVAGRCGDDHAALEVCDL
jgi:hypothetical protein